MERYGVFLIGTAFYRMHSIHHDKAQAAEDYNRVVARTEAVLVRVGGPSRNAVSVLAAWDTAPDILANDPVLMHAVRGAFGLAGPGH
jgi:hypothetical protein